MKRVYIDMDGVLCKYHEEFLKMVQLNPKIQYPQTQYGFYVSLPEVEGAIEAYLELEKYYDVWILTRPSWQNPLCYSEKRVWVEQHLSKEHCKKLILCYDKSLLKGDYLIDDNSYDFEGQSILFKSKEFPDWKTVLDVLVPSKLQEWSGYITKVRGNEIDVRLKDLTSGGTEEETTFDLKKDIKLEYKHLIEEGACFTWSIGENKLKDGVSSINFMLPFTKEEMEKMQTQAKEYADKMIQDLKWI